MEARMPRMRDATWQAVPGVPEDRGAEWVPMRHWQSPDPVGAALAAATAPLREAVEAYVNEGRWVVCCPNCAGAQLACRTDRRFMCNECANLAIGGRWRRVVWPKDVDRIEAALDRRKLLAHRNWLPGETAQDLLDEESAMESLPPVIDAPGLIQGRGV